MMDAERKCTIHTSAMFDQCLARLSIANNTRPVKRRLTLGGVDSINIGYQIKESTRSTGRFERKGPTVLLLQPQPQLQLQRYHAHTTMLEQYLNYHSMADSRTLVASPMQRRVTMRIACIKKLIDLGAGVGNQLTNRFDGSCLGSL
jgi:hypothetical protein